VKKPEVVIKEEKKIEEKKVEEKKVEAKKDETIIERPQAVSPSTITAMSNSPLIKSPEPILFNDNSLIAQRSAFSLNVQTMPLDYNPSPMVTKTFNFTSERGTISKEVLRLAQSQIINLTGSGLSFMDMSLSSREYQGVLQRSRDNLRRLLNIPDEFQVLFQLGGSSLQHTALCHNLLSKGSAEKAVYLNSGSRSLQAIDEAKRLTNIQIIDAKSNTKID
jgi:hypothetical protein